MGAGSRKSRSFLVSGATASLPRKPWREPRCWLYGLSQSGWSTAKARPSISAFPSPWRHEPVAVGEGQARTRSIVCIGWRLKRQSGSHRTLSREGWPDLVFAFDDGGEMGPRMLTRMAKHTGLSPKDLQAPSSHPSRRPTTSSGPPTSVLRSRRGADPSVRPRHLLHRTAGYVTRSSGGVGAGGREAFSYPDWTARNRPPTTLGSSRRVMAAEVAHAKQ